MLLIPAIDLRGGRCVRLYQGDFAAETRYDVEPQTLLESYAAIGATWLHVVDLDGARDGEQPNRPIIVQLAAQGGINLQVGGGVRDASTIETLLRAGVKRLVIGSAAVKHPDGVRHWLRHFGAETLVLAFDVRLDDQRVPRCVIHGWREASSLDLWQAVEAFRAEGLRHVLCTDVSRDGALSGPNIHLYKEAVKIYPQLAWQASGGVKDAADLHALAGAGVAAAVSGRALLEKRMQLEELKPFLPNA